MTSKPEDLGQLQEKYDKVCQELEATKGQLLENQKERDEVKSELHDVREELERTQSQMDEILGELEQTHFELHQLKEKGEVKQVESSGELEKQLEETRAKLEESQLELGNVREELEKTQSQLDEVLGELEQTHFELHQLKEKGENSQSDLEIKKELEETKVKLRETEELLEKSQSQLGETMEVLEEYQSQMEETMGVLEESQGKLEQQQSGSESELQKELEETKSQLRESEELLEQYQSQLEETMEVLEKSQSQLKHKQEEPELVNVSNQEEHKKPLFISEDITDKNRLFQIQNAIVERFQIFRGRFELVGGPVLPNDIPGVFRHRRSGHKDQPKYLDNNFQSNNTNNSPIEDSKFHRGTYIYGGFFNGHFGHVLTESIHRLWAFNPSVHEGIVFALLSATPRRVPIHTYTPPDWFSQILEVLDIPLSSCMFVTDRRMFENLVIPEPGSELSLGMKQWYRPYLEKLQQKILDKTYKMRENIPKLKLFLTRNHIPMNGMVAGEEYLESLLVDEGYVSFKPENYHFLEQIAYLINAKKVIFTEGSAIYSLELINYLDTEIACLPRRSDNKLFYPHLKSKCRHYITAGNVDNCLRLGSYNMQDGGNGISIIKSPDQIVEFLRQHNFAMLRDWNKNKFLAQEKCDLMQYTTEGYNLLQQKEPVHCLNVIEKYLQVRNTSLTQTQQNPVSKSQDNSSYKIYKNMKLTIRSERINQLATLNQSSNYLEIGVHRGVTFQKVNVDKKVGVDPKFFLNKDEYPKDKVVFLEITSDEFFRNHAQNFPAFDLIYLDGLHTFEQTFRDFCASISCAHSRTIWLIDDTCPGSYAQAQASQRLSKRLKELSGEKDGSWMGDVFKIVAAIHDFFPQYSFATFPHHGQTVVWKKWRTNFEPKWNSLETISRLQYSDFVEQQATIFKKDKYENIFSTIKRDLNQL